MRKELKMEKCREEFEIFWIRRCEELEIKCVLTRSAIDGDYLYINANYAWIGWQASRESMKVIELPDQADYFSVEYDNDENEILGFDIEGYSSDVRDAITSAGYKVE